MGIQDAAIRAGDDEIRSALDRGEADRQERWRAEAEDKQSLRHELEEPVSRVVDAPKPKPKRSLDDDGPSDPRRPFDGIRQTAERAFDDEFVNAARENRRQRDHEQFEVIAQQIKRAHGVDGVEGMRALVAAEKALRENPEVALNKLANDYYSNRDLAAATEQREQQNTIAEVTKFFDSYDIPEQIVEIMARYMETPGFQRTRTGDHQADMARAYRDVKRGMDRVRAR